ncbi:MAG: DUF763 domain-containing protein [Patescibacteria group bacterium]|nr:DUF763 domain-containing protein [Patescibacteria group bacterium]
MRTGIATVPLDYGKCPYWLFEKMTRLSRAIALIIREEFGADEFLKRISDPIWFQSLSCVIGMDWNSSGSTTITMGALKEGLRGIENDLGVFICGGKGKTSKKTPDQIQKWGEFLDFSSEKINKLIYASKISAKVDSGLIQDGFQIYHHNLIFSKSGNWTVIQQGMNVGFQKARRYHWLSSDIKDFVEQPHSGIASDLKLNPLNLIAEESKANKKISAELVKEEPQTFLKDIKLITEKSDSLIQQKKIPGFTEIELNNIEFDWHPIEKEKFDLKRLKKIIEVSHFLEPKSFEDLLMIKGVGPKTIRALSLVAELIYSKKPSYEDPARYSFAHGGKDSTPFPVDRKIYDNTLEVLQKGIRKSKISNREKIEAEKRLNSLRS